jgi:hypothetical protein
MYRICISSNGFYYVQQNTGFRWVKTGDFYRTRKGAENLIRDLKTTRQCNRVVGYY